MLPNIYNELANMNEVKQKVYRNINHIRFKLEAALEIDIDELEFYFVDNGVQNGLCLPILIKIDNDIISMEDIYEFLHHIPFYKINASGKLLKPINKVSQNNVIKEVKELSEYEMYVNDLTIEYLIGLLKNKDIMTSIKQIKEECGLKIININKDSRFIPYIDKLYYNDKIALVSNLDMFYDDNVIIVDYRELQMVEKGKLYRSIGIFKIKNRQHIYDKSHIALITECTSCHRPFIFDYYDGLKNVCPKCC